MSLLGPFLDAGKETYHFFADDKEKLQNARRKRQSAEQLLMAQDNILRREAAALLQSAYLELLPVLSKSFLNSTAQKLEYLEECWTTKFCELDTYRLMGVSLTALVTEANGIFEPFYDKLSEDVGPKHAPSEYNRFSRRMEDAGNYEIGGNQKAMKQVADSRRKYDAELKRLT